MVGAHATIFDAAGVNTNTISRFGADFSQANRLIQAYNADGEILSFVQDMTPFTPSAAGVRSKVTPYLPVPVEGGVTLNPIEAISRVELHGLEYLLGGLGALAVKR